MNRMVIGSIRRRWDKVFEVISPYMYVAPALIFFVLFLAYPIFFAINLSFHDWNGMTSVGSMKYVGLANYRELIGDPLFWLSVRNTVQFSIVDTVAQMALSFMLAFALWYFPLPFNKTIRAIIFFPGVVMMVIVGLTWRELLSTQGLVNGLLSAITRHAVTTQWLGNPNLALWSVIWVDVWTFTGTNMIIWLSGLLAIPSDLIDAAKIDGANLWQLLTRVIVPLLEYVISLSFILNIVGGFQAFGTVYVTSHGGPAHQSEVLATYVFWNAFAGTGPQRFAYASTICVAMIVVLIAFSYYRVRVSNVL